MFLTLEDPNARIKGSRDPLGVQAIWASFGRRVVTNLTTVTGSVRGFTVLMLGRYLVERAIDDQRLRRESALDGFLRFEQLAAYARYVGHGVDTDILGIERVKRNASERGGRVVIASNRNGYILSDQKTYGLWGLYSVSARVSGLVPEGAIGVTGAAREFVEAQYLPALEHAWRRLEQFVAVGGTLDTRGRDPVFEAVSAILPERLTGQEASFYRTYLRDAAHVTSDARSCQAILVRLLEQHADPEAATSRAEVQSLARAARERDAELAHRLERILVLEGLLAPAAVLFDHVLSCHNRRISEIAAELREVWGPLVPDLNPEGFRALVPEIAHAAGEEIAGCTARCVEALAGGAYADAIETALDWNAAVMAGRQGAPWVRRDGTRLDVRYRGSEQLLPGSDALAHLWRNSYFIDSLKRITHTLGSVAG